MLLPYQKQNIDRLRELGTVSVEIHSRHASVKSFHDYFELIEYPQYLASNPLPINICWQYVSVDLLNGFINHTKVIRAWAVNRHHSINEIDHKHNFLVTTGSQVGYIKNVIGEQATRKEVIDYLCSRKDSTLNTEMRKHFNDDVILLAQCGDIDGNVQYYYYWFDCDVSDCFIGRFVTTDDQTTVIASFDHMVVESQMHFPFTDPATLIPLHYFKGHISF